MVAGLQHIAQQSENSPHRSPAYAADELGAAAAIQRKLFLFMLAAQDPVQEASVQAAVLHTTACNLQQPWRLVQETHEQMLVSGLAALTAAAHCSAKRVFSFFKFWSGYSGVASGLSGCTRPFAL